MEPLPPTSETLIARVKDPADAAAWTDFVRSALARVEGNVYYGLIEMAIGAEINGKLVHEPPKDGASSGQKAPSEPTVSPTDETEVAREPAREAIPPVGNLLCTAHNPA